MKRFLLAIFCFVPLFVSAQLEYDVEMNKEKFEAPNTVYSKQGTVRWDEMNLFSIHVNGMLMGATVLIGDDKEHFVVVALPNEGLPEKVSFSYIGASRNGVMAIYESSDHENWSSVWSTQGIDLATKYDSAMLKPTTRYLKFEYVGKSYVFFNAITVKEKKSLSTNVDEWQFPTAMVDEPVATKTVTVSWTNIVAHVSCSDTAFSVNPSTIGQKNLENQTTNLVITYRHIDGGNHSADVIIEGEGRKAVVHVSGSTKRYQQNLSWNDPLGTYSTTDNLQLNAFTDYGQPVNYLSSDSSIALVDEAGNVQILCAGTVELTAWQMGNRKFEPSNQVTKSVTFVRTKPVVAITSDTLVYGQKAQAANLRERLGLIDGSVRFVSVNPDSVFDAGLYTVDVLFVPDNRCIYESVERKISLYVEQAPQVISWLQEKTSLQVDEQIELTAQSTSGLPITYAFTACNITIDGNRMIGAEEGKVWVIAFQQGNSNYLPSIVLMQEFEVEAKPEVTTSIEQQYEVEPTLEVLNRDGQKYYHNGQVLIYYNSSIYNSDGKIVLEK